MATFKERNVGRGRTVRNGSGISLRVKAMDDTRTEVEMEIRHEIMSNTKEAYIHAC